MPKKTPAPKVKKNASAPAAEKKTTTPASSSKQADGNNFVVLNSGQIFHYCTIDEFTNAKSKYGKKYKFVEVARAKNETDAIEIINSYQ